MMRWLTREGLGTDSGSFGCNFSGSHRLRTDLPCTVLVRAQGIPGRTGTGLEAFPSWRLQCGVVMLGRAILTGVLGTTASNEESLQARSRSIQSRCGETELPGVVFPTIHGGEREIF